MEFLKDPQMHPLLRSHPNFCQVFEEFQAFLGTALEDLEAKAEVLRQRRSSAEVSQISLRSYLDCQTFMLARHSRRLRQFEQEIQVRLGQVLKGTPKGTPGDQRGPQGLGRIARIPGNLRRRKSTGDDADLIQLLADISKMKRRCKHILDVTDRYCVLEPVGTGSATGSRLPELELTGAATAASPCSSIEEDSVDGTVKGPAGLETVQNQNQLGEGSPPGSRSQITMISTLESMGSHLAVIAKTYTRKKGSFEQQEVPVGV